MIDPRTLRTDLSRAYGAYNVAVRQSVQPQIMGWVSFEVLDGIATIATVAKNVQVAALHGRLLTLLGDPNLAASDQLRDDFKKEYEKAQAIVFPAATAFVAHSQALTAWTRNHNLVTTDLNRLRNIDLKAHTDPAFAEYVDKMVAILPALTAAPDVTRYSQFFELYSEALVLEFLRSKVKTKKIPEQAGKTPDFQCELEDGRTFYVEVKTLDIVGGALRHDEVMFDAIDQAVSLDAQIAEGAAVAIAEGETAPYKRAGEKDTYDPNSLLRVIDTLRDKCWQAFKAGQFAMGPTFALAVTDRLIVPGGRCALAPYYFDPYDAGYCVSGVLWHSVFGKQGSLILRLPDFPGAASIEGDLSTPGIFVDEGRSFPGIGLITLSRSRDGDSALGLYPKGSAAIGTWTVADTQEALAAICDAYNDDFNARAFELSRIAYP